MLKKGLILFLVILISTVSSVYALTKPRWVTQPIYVYIPKCGQFSQMMVKAFRAWETKSNELVRFKFTANKEDANIEVRFLKYVEDCNSENAVGCARMTTKNAQFYHGYVDIALTKRADNNEFRPINNIYGVMLHEIGHALGLGHSENPYSIMYPIDLPTNQYLTKDDMELLYNKYH